MTEPVDVLAAIVVLGMDQDDGRGADTLDWGLPYRWSKADCEE